MPLRFTQLLERYEREIFRYAYRLSGNPDDAADILQDTFLRAFKAFPRLPANANHRAWLYRIAHRQALNSFRAAKVRESLSIDEVIHEANGVQDLERRPDRLAETRLLAGRLRVLLAGLTVRQRAALLLKKYEGLSYREVARVLGCTQENARAHVYQAMKKIRNGLTTEE